MRVLIVSGLYPPYGMGGYELRCSEVANALANIGHEVAVLTSRYGLPARRSASPPAPATGGGPEVFRALRQYHFGPQSAPRCAYVFGTLRPQLRDARYLRRLLDSFRPHVVNWWSVSGLTKAILPLPRLRGIPDLFCADDVSLIHELGPRSESERPPWSRLWVIDSPSRLWHYPMRYMLRAWSHVGPHRDIPTAPVRFSPSRVCFVSEFLRGQYEAAGFAFPSTEVIHGGVHAGQFLASPDRQPPDPPGLRLLYAGVITRTRGLATVVEALAQLPPDIRRRTTLSVVGALPEEEAAFARELKDRIRALNLATRVSFLGHRSHADMPQIYRTHDVLVAPTTLPEGLPRNIIEATLSGCLAVTTGSGGSLEFARRAELPLFPKEDSPALARLLERFALNPQERHEVARRAQEAAREYFTFEPMMARLLQSLESVAGLRGSAAALARRSTP